MSKSHDRNSFYISLHRKGKLYAGHMISMDPPSNTEEFFSKPRVPQVDTPISSEALDFKNVFKTFTSTMESYRKFIPLTLNFVPILSAVIAQENIGNFAKKKGKKRDDLSTKTVEIYECDLDCYREFKLQNDEALAALGGAKHLPEAMVISLVSVYDAFLSKLLRVALNKHSEIVLTSEKSIKYSDLKKFSSIEEASLSLIDKEIEGIIRLSHHEQFDRMEKLFSMPLRTNLTIWPQFIELCERRNLLTHVGGIVSQQYIINCKSQKCDVSNIKIGTKLGVDNKYFVVAVNCIYEVGIKLGYVFWRKFAAHERDDADRALNDLCFQLIFWRAYNVAEALLSFGVETIKTRSGLDQTRRMMVVNLANAVKLQKRKEDAQKILNKEDWSASSDNFLICVAAIKEDIDFVIDLMKKMGKNNSFAEHYRMWPVFKNINTDKRFIDAFESIFGEPFIVSSTVDISHDAEETPSQNNTPNEQLPTKH